MKSNNNKEFAFFGKRTQPALGKAASNLILGCSNNQDVNRGVLAHVSAAFVATAVFELLYVNSSKETLITVDDVEIGPAGTKPIADRLIRLSAACDGLLVYSTGDDKFNPWEAQRNSSALRQLQNLNIDLTLDSGKLYIPSSIVYSLIFLAGSIVNGGPYIQELSIEGLMKMVELLLDVAAQGDLQLWLIVPGQPPFRIPATLQSTDVPEAYITCFEYLNNSCAIEGKCSRPPQKQPNRNKLEDRRKRRKN